MEGKDGESAVAIRLSIECVSPSGNSWGDLRDEMRETSFTSLSTDPDT